MKIMKYLCPQAIVIDLKATDKRSAIMELTESLKKANKIRAAKDVADTLLLREKLGSTGIGQGIAIPQCRCESVQEPVAALGISRGGIEYESLDGERVHIVFLMLNPAGTVGTHLKAMVRVFRLLKNNLVRQALMAAESVQDVMNLIHREDCF